MTKDEAKDKIEAEVIISCSLLAVMILDCDYHATLLGMSLGRHDTVLSGHLATHVGISLGRHGTTLSGHHATIVSLSMVLSYVATMPHLLV